MLHEALLPEQVTNQFPVARDRHLQPFQIPVPGETSSKKNHIFQRIQFKRKSQHIPRNRHTAPVRANLDRNLVDVLEAFPPLIAESQSYLADNDPCRGVGQCERAIWTLCDVDKQLVLALRKVRKSDQTAIGLQAFHQRWRAKIAQI